MKAYLELFKTTFKEWNEDNVPLLASSLAYYTAFSLTPLLMVMIAILGFVYSDEAAQGQIVTTLSRELGPDIAQFLQELIQNADNEKEGIFSTIVSTIMLLIGATGVFMQLQNALNEVWNIKVEGGFFSMLKKRLLSFGILITIGFLLLVSLVVTSVIASLDTFIMGILPSTQLIIHIIIWCITLGVTTLLFAIIYKYMPDAKIEWHDVLVGAFFTALMFNVGRFALGLYIGNVTIASSYGAAGSFVVILVWVYYSAQIVMFGAEFTQVYARTFGTKIIPEASAMFNTPSQDKQIEGGQKSEPISPLISPRPEELPMQQVEDAKRSIPNFTFILSFLTAIIGVIVGWIVGQDTKAE